MQISPVAVRLCIELVEITLGLLLLYLTYKELVSR